MYKLFVRKRRPSLGSFKLNSASAGSANLAFKRPYATVIFRQCICMYFTYIYINTHTPVCFDELTTIVERTTVLQ
jgi:hypothetical protein